MHRFNKSIWFCLFLMTAYARAQNTFPATGNVGIGTTAPGSLLDINGAQQATSSATYSSGSLRLTGNYWTGSASAPDYWSITNLIPGYTQPSQSNLLFQHVGTSTAAQVDILTSSPSTYIETTATIPLVVNNTDPTVNNFVQIGFGDWNANAGSIGFQMTHHGQAYGDFVIATRNSSGWGERFRLTSLGNVGIGTTSPAYPLDVAGKMHSTAGVVYPDGTTQTTAWTGVLCGGDYAEAVEASGAKEAYEPGDVLVITEVKTGDVEKSADPYSTTVAGIFATKPGVIGRRDTLSKTAEDLPMAMVGIVPTKVSAENGPIRRGDLLVTSSTPGYAMKGTDRSRMLGAVIGKAMGSLDSGTGVLEVLVTLQ